MNPYPYKLVIERVDGESFVIVGDNRDGEMGHIARFLMTDPERYKSALLVENK